MPAADDGMKVVPLPAAAPAPATMEREPQGPRPMFQTEAEAKDWASEWWAQYSKDGGARAEAHNYFEAESIFRRLEARAEGGLHPVRLLRGSWLLRRAAKLRRASSDDERRRLALPRRQVLEEDHPEAFLSSAEVRALPRGHTQQEWFTCCGGLPCAVASCGGLGCSDVGLCPECCPHSWRELRTTTENCGRGLGVEEAKRPLRIVSISHGWLTPEHPDPLGQNLVTFADTVVREQMCVGGATAVDIWGSVLTGGLFGPCCPWGLPLSGQDWFHNLRAFPRGEFGVFFDFASLHQKDEAGERSASERAAFGAALGTMGEWYAHKLLTTYVINSMPPGWGDAAKPYEQRGWTTFESSVSALLKEGG